MENLIPPLGYRSRYPAYPKHKASMNVYINNTRTFDSYTEHFHHHDLMLANGLMACANRDQHKIEFPADGDLIALYANGLGIVAYGYATDDISLIDDARTNGHPTKIRRLRDFHFLAYPIHSREYETSNTQTLSKVESDVECFVENLLDRKLPGKDGTLFSNTSNAG